MMWRCNRYLHLYLFFFPIFLQSFSFNSRGYTLHTHFSCEETPLLCLLSDSGFMLSSSDTNMQRAFDVSYMTVAACDQALMLNTCPLLQKDLWFQTKEKIIYINGRAYYGSLHVTCDGDTIKIVLIGNAHYDALNTMRSHTCKQWNVTECVNRWHQMAYNMRDTIEQAKKRIKKSHNLIQVLLNEQKIDKKPSWDLFSMSGFLIYDAEHAKKRYFIEKSDITITYKKNNFYVNEHWLPSKRMHIIPLKGCITYNDHTYEGDFIFTTKKNRALCINMLDLESYVCSVVHTESWPGWPLEVNKAFAIMARSYAMAQMYEAQKNKRPYHIKNTNAHQTYTGIHTIQNIQQAVEETEGMLLVYKNQPILAMFDSCCGGIIPMHIQDYIDFNKAPYLARSYPCHYCKSCKIYAWQVEYDLAVFERRICSELHALHTLHHAKVIKKDKAGLVLEVLLHGAKATHTISGRRLYSLLHEVKSFCFDVKCKNKKIILSGRGYGHHCGLCQWGAREMVRHGFNYKRILSFYYPKTKLMKMT